MQKFSSFGRKKKNRPKFDIEWICSKTFNYHVLPDDKESDIHGIPPAGSLEFYSLL